MVNRLTDAAGPNVKLPGPMPGGAGKLSSTTIVIVPPGMNTLTVAVSLTETFTPAWTKTLPVPDPMRVTPLAVTLPGVVTVKSPVAAAIPLNIRKREINPSFQDGGISLEGT